MGKGSHVLKRPETLAILTIVFAIVRISKYCRQNVRGSSLVVSTGIRCISPVSFPPLAVHPSDTKGKKHFEVYPGSSTGVDQSAAVGFMCCSQACWE